MRRALAALAVLIVLAALLTGCTGGHPQGPAGRVVAKDTDRDCHTTWTGTGSKRRSHSSCHTEYELTTRDRHGGLHEFEVSGTVYDRCRRGSAYPTCTHR
ncbi:hypothetical protein ABTX35_19295 [Streptomyces sp. NPDC096080]|uniref:hypothetical protein n=1 Tax=Streptomyces sp. NPDC096080 TaxID=3156693 RepID=UPI003320106E